MAISRPSKNVQQTSNFKRSKRIQTHVQSPADEFKVIQARVFGLSVPLCSQWCGVSPDGSDNGIAGAIKFFMNSEIHIWNFSFVHVSPLSSDKPQIWSDRQCIYTFVVKKYRNSPILPATPAGPLLTLIGRKSKTKFNNLRRTTSRLRSGVFLPAFAALSNLHD